MVAALLDEDGRQTELGQPSSRFGPVATDAHLELATPGRPRQRPRRATRRARRCGPLGDRRGGEPVDGGEPSEVSGPGSQWQVQRGPPSPASAPVSSAKPTTCGNQPAPGSTWTDRSRRPTGLEDPLLPLPWCASMSTMATRPCPARGGLRGDGGVVEVAGAAVRPPRHMMTGRPAEGVRGKAAPPLVTRSTAVTAQHPRPLSPRVPGSGSDERHRRRQQNDPARAWTAVGSCAVAARRAIASVANMYGTTLS